MSSLKDKLNNLSIKQILSPLFILLLIALFVRFNYAYNIYITNNSFPKSNDSFWYVDKANELLQSFKIDLDFNGVFYISYYSLVAVLILIFKTDVSVVIFQVFLGVITIIPLYKTVEALLNKRTAILASLFYIFIKELKYWSVYILTDSIFISNLIFMIYGYTFYKLKNTRKYLIIFTINVLYMIFLRPAGLITLCFMFVFLIVDNYSLLKSFFIKYKRICIISTLGCIPFMLLTAYFILKSSIGLSFYWNMRWLIFKNYGAGQIFDLPTAYDHKYSPIINNQYFNNFVLSFFINNFYHIIIIYAKRFIFLCGDFWIWNYSFKDINHALKYFYNCLPLILAGIGMIRVILKKPLHHMIFFIPVISTVIFCVIFFLDSGWRYRLPSLPFMGIFAAFGLELFISLILDKVIIKFFSTKLNQLKVNSSNNIKA